jgi:hypothetical protein
MDVELIAVVGDMEYPEIPIIVTEQTTTMVKFKVQNSFTETLTNLYVQFHEGSTGDNECYPDSNVGVGDYVEYTAYCMHNCPITIVELWAQDNSFDAAGNNAVVPECCHPLTDHSAPVVQYTFKIHCEPQCPQYDATGSVRRSLAEHANVIKEGSLEALMEFQDRDAAAAFAGAAVDEVEEDNGTSGLADSHFCTATDYPCGDDDSKVYVCHYSARQGYQTFCVPEQDSDIMSFYPKDYCGPCVGGYAADSR